MEIIYVLLSLQDLWMSKEKAMAPHSSTLAWKIPWTEEPGGPQFMGSLRVGQDSATSLWLFTFVYWRRKWQPTPVFLPRESQGRGSLVGCRLRGRTESDTTDLAAARRWPMWKVLWIKEFYSFIVTLGDLTKDIVTRHTSKGGYLVSFLEA